MIYYKTLEEISAIKESALLLGKAHGEVAKRVKSGISTKELDKVAEEYIKDNGAKPSFLGYNGFPASLCISVNEVVVHGIPSSYTLKEGDIVSIDCGVYFNNFHADSAFTYSVGEVDKHTKLLLEVTKSSLYKGIEAMNNGSRIGDISFAIQHYAESNGFSIVRELVGHGVGKKLHEKPDVPNFGKRGRGSKLENGLVIAIEPMINMGNKNIIQERDGWTIRTKDKKPSAHFEHTVAFVNGKP
ncbi:MAG: type I methionyl aminopeptidase [Bacteroidota bacterium]